ncbi:MAG: aspartate aminotransferase family protein [Spirochaetales bacterium]|nr:aspartate aminotransferase family protein [Spirochaetales bacterium]
MEIKGNMVINPPYPNNYSPELLVLDKGEGVFLYDITGKKYLDFGAGIAVNALGHNRKDLAQTAYDQMSKLIHTSNLYATDPSLKLAEKLVSSGPYAAVHFGNSGTEAIEAAIKYARLYSHKAKGEGNHKILCFNNAFHGRSLGALSVTPNPKYQEPFKPLVPGVTSIPLNDSEALKKTLDKSYAACIVEVVQGEGGMDSLTPEFAKELNDACTDNDVILIADEIQTGLSRTGTLYAHTTVGLKPDIVALAKPLAGGLPLSATLIPEKINRLLDIGMHGTTFGGGPVTTAVAGKVWDILANPSFIKDVNDKGLYLKNLLTEMKNQYPVIKAVKGMGLLQGLELDIGADAFTDVLKKIQNAGVLILRSGKTVLRIVPPLTISKEEIKGGCSIISEVLKGVDNISKVSKGVDNG